MNRSVALLLITVGLAVFASVDTGADEIPGGEFPVEITPDFLLDDGRDLRRVGGPSVRALLSPVKGRGWRFGDRQKERYCALKRNDSVQWVVNDIATGEVLSRSANADRLFFGASTSKIFVAGAFLDKKHGDVSREELELLTRMIVVSNNGAWLELQRRTGDSGSADGGRAAVHAFVRRMGYPTIRGFQGWMRREDGSRVHGNELNAIEVSRFLRDTYRQKYPGAEILWEIMQATKTGGSKIDKYTPNDVYIAGKTGTYNQYIDLRLRVRLHLDRLCVPRHCTFWRSPNEQ